MGSNTSQELSTCDDKDLHFLVSGFTRKYAMNSKLDIPFDIIALISLYSKAMDYNVIITFSAKYCDRKKSKISHKKTCIMCVY